MGDATAREEMRVPRHKISYAGSNVDVGACRSVCARSVFKNAIFKAEARATFRSPDRAQDSLVVAVEIEALQPLGRRGSRDVRMGYVYQRLIEKVHIFDGVDMSANGKVLLSDQQGDAVQTEDVALSGPGFPSRASSTITR